MATRDENLKKINAELEQLTDKQLDQVAGGLSPIITNNHSNETDPAKKLTTDIVVVNDDRPP